MGLKSSIERRWVPILALVPLVLALAVVGSQAKNHSQGWLGVYIQNIDEDLMDSESLPSTDGVLITDVLDDSPAEKAGLKRGDVILIFDGSDVRSANRLTRLIERSEPGENKNLVILRDGAKNDIVVTIGEDDDEMDFSFFGHGDPDVHVEIPDVPSPPRAFTFSLGNVSTSRIGVSLYELSEQLARHYGSEDGGALINEIFEGSPAEKAGLQAGDVIVKMDGKAVEDIDEIREAIQDKDEGDEIAVTVIRDGTESLINVEVEGSSTWSGVGDRRFVTPRAMEGRAFRWNSRNDWSSDDIRESLRDARGDYGEWREELEDAMKELREELRELKKELKEKGF